MSFFNKISDAANVDVLRAVESDEQKNCSAKVYNRRVSEIVWQ